MVRVRLHSGLDVAYDHWGAGDGQPVVLLHGGGQTRHAWRGAGERLGEAGYRTIAPDLRGHGDSSWAETGDYEYDALVGDLGQFLDQTGLTQPVLVGASLGGAVSLLAVGEGVTDAAGLVVVDTAPRIEQHGVSNLRTFMTQKPEGFASLDEVAAAIAAYNPQRRRSPNLDGLAKNLRVDAAGRLHWHWDPRFMGPERATMDWDARQTRMENSVRSLTLPTLLVRGGLSDMLSEAGAAGFLELCPHAEYVNITGASHMVAGDRNDRFSGSVVDFLERVAPA